jgi:hypothetical protein
MMLKSKRSMPTGILETIIVGIPRVAKVMEDLPVEQLWSVLAAVEDSYRGALDRYGFSEADCVTLTSAIMRRLKGQLGADGLTEKEMMIRVCEELGFVDYVVAAGAVDATASVKQAGRNHDGKARLSLVRSIGQR